MTEEINRSNNDINNFIGKKVFYVRDYNAYEGCVEDIKDEFIKINGMWYRQEEIKIRDILK